MSELKIIEPTEPATRHGIDYLNRAFDNPASLISESMRVLEKVQYDTLVGTGLSGALIVPILARALGRHWMIVRKAKDQSHSSAPYAGTMGYHWIFVDDLICSGDTRDRCRYVIAALREEDDNRELTCHKETHYVGTLLYGVTKHRVCRFYPKS